ncbi:Helix-turn-helix domain-containing protein, partial [Succinivibrio dextrinosolvens]
MTDTNLAKLAFKFKLEPNGEQRRFFSRTAGCTRFVYNHLLFKCREDFREYLEEIDSRQSNGEALNRDEAKKLSFRPLCYKCITGLNYLLPDLRKE